MKYATSENRIYDEKSVPWVIISCSYCFEWSSAELEYKGRKGQVLTKVVEDDRDNTKN